MTRAPATTPDLVLAPITINNGHPSDTWGWVVGAGVKFLIGADVLDTQFNYTQGATKYVSTGVSAGGWYCNSNGANGDRCG